MGGGSEVGTREIRDYNNENRFKKVRMQMEQWALA